MPRRVVSPGQVSLFEGVNRSDKPDYSNLLKGNPHTRESLEHAIEEFKKIGPLLVLDSCSEDATVQNSSFFSDIPTKKRAPKKFSPKSPRAFQSAVADAKERIEERTNPNAWVGAEPSTILGLYAALHENCYGFLPEDLSDEWLIALKTVQGWLKNHFGDSVPNAVAFLRWRWSKEKRLRANNQDRERLLWKWVFNHRSVMDYKVARGSSKK
jgi:hypothetical protein